MCLVLLSCEGTSFVYLEKSFADPLQPSKPFEKKLKLKSRRKQLQLLIVRSRELSPGQGRNDPFHWLPNNIRASSQICRFRRILIDFDNDCAVFFFIMSGYLDDLRFMIVTGHSVSGHEKKKKGRNRYNEREYRKIR